MSNQRVRVVVDNERLTKDSKKPVRRRPERTKPEVRYGPFSRPEDQVVPDVPTSVVFTLINLCANFSVTPTPFNSPVRSHYIWKNLSFPDFNDIDEADFDTYHRVLRFQGMEPFLINGGIDDGGTNLKPDQVMFIDNYTGREYRTDYARWPLPYFNTETFGISLVVNNDSEVVSASNPKWRPSITPQQVIDRNPDEDHTDEFSWINELDAPGNLDDQDNNDSLQSFWNFQFRDWWQAHAELKTKPFRKNQRLQFRVDTDLVYFEPFDPWDTANYKVTLGSFDDEEVDLSSIKGGIREVVIGLVPRLWRFEYSRTEWWIEEVIDPGPAGLFLIELPGCVFTSWAPAFTCPVTSRSDFCLLGGDNIILDGSVGELNQVTTAVQGEEVLEGVFEWTITTTQSVTAIDLFPNQNINLTLLWEYGSSEGNDSPRDTAAGRRPPTSDFTTFTQFNGTSSRSLNVEVEYTPERAEVGRFRVRNTQYFVFRRTELGGGQPVNSGGLEGDGLRAGPLIGEEFPGCKGPGNYEGSFTDLAFANGDDGSTARNYWAVKRVSTSGGETFASMDPGDFFDHVTN